MHRSTVRSAVTRKKRSQNRTIETISVIEITIVSNFSWPKIDSDRNRQKISYRQTNKLRFFYRFFSYRRKRYLCVKFPKIVGVGVMGLFRNISKFCCREIYLPNSTTIVAGPRGSVEFSLTASFGWPYGSP